MSPIRSNVKKAKPSLRPMKAQARSCDEAWFYENGASIDVLTYVTGREPQMCRISKRQIKAWLRRVGQ